MWLTARPPACSACLEEGKQLVESLDGVEALWCTTDGEVVTSSGWNEHTN